MAAESGSAVFPGDTFFGLPVLIPPTVTQMSNRVCPMALL